MSKNIENEFVEAMGLILQGDGMPRIAGRLLGLFVLHGGPFSFAELSEALDVSRGSISTNTRLLEDLGIIERVALRGERQDYFKLSDEPYAELVERKMVRSIKALDSISKTAEKLENTDPATLDRIGELANFYRILADATDGALAVLRKRDTPQIRAI